MRFSTQAESVENVVKYRCDHVSPLAGLYGPVLGGKYHIEPTLSGSAQVLLQANISDLDISAVRGGADQTMSDASWPCVSRSLGSNSVRS